MGPTSSSNTTQRTLPSHLQPSGSLSQQQQQLCGCEEDGTGQCLTASWERAFQAALQTTVDENVRRKRPSSSNPSASSAPLFAQASSAAPGPTAHSAVGTSSSSPATSIIQSPTTNALAPPQGRQCSDCGKPSIVLYPSGDDHDDVEGTLICKQCRRHRRRRHPDSSNSKPTSAPFMQNC